MPHFVSPHPRPFPQDGGRELDSPLSQRGRGAGSEGTLPSPAGRESAGQGSLPPLGGIEGVRLGFDTLHFVPLLNPRLQRGSSRASARIETQSRGFDRLNPRRGVTPSEARGLKVSHCVRNDMRERSK